MSSSASDVGFRDYLSRKSLKSYTRRRNIIFRRRECNVSHSFLQTYCGPFVTGLRGHPAWSADVVLPFNSTYWGPL